MPALFNEVELAKSLGVLWADWQAQPPEDRALYVAHGEYREMMGRIEQAEQAAGVKANG